MGEVRATGWLTGLCEAAALVEAQRKTNPINGDCSNYTLTQALNAIVRLAGDDGPAVLAAVQVVKDDRAAEDARWYERAKQMNAEADQ